MRPLHYLLAGSFLGVLVACSGEVATEDSSTTASKQKAEEAASRDGASSTSEASQADRSRPAERGSPSGATGVAEYSESACFHYGAPAEGECTVGDSELCDGYTETSSSSGAPTTYCKRICVNQNGKAVWSEKSHDSKCAFFDSEWHVDVTGCSCDDKAKADFKKLQESSSTPLVLSFDGAPVAFTSAAGGAFDLVADGQCHGSDWPSAATPWLALDRDGNGVIDDGGELFGSAVRLANGQRAKNGFEALRELDQNHDGVFDAEDEAFARVVVWTDRDGDRRSTPRELTSLAAAGVRSIRLDDRAEPRCDARGNCEGERASFTTTAGARGTVIDVYLATR